MSLEPVPGSMGWLHSHGSYATHLGLLKPISTFFQNPYLVQGLTYGAVSTATQACWSLLRWSMDRIGFPWFVTGHFTQQDSAYEWIMYYLFDEGIWRRSTAYRVSAGYTPKAWAPRTGATSLLNKSGNTEFTPTWEKPKLFRWNGYWIDVKGTETMEQNPMHGVTMKTTSLKITVYSFDVDVLSRFVEDARSRYMKLKNKHVIIHLQDTHRFGPGAMWSQVKRKARRPLDTVILQKGVLDDLVADAREFLASEDFYNQAGVPHRRGVLLWGPPGTGKTTTIYSIAGELGLEIYSLSLSSSMVDDGILQAAASSIPKDGILLIEDIDCAFPNRDDDDENLKFAEASFHGRRRGSAVTMSGLLNFLDGVGSDEGKLFFATTNYVDRLDPAILRPGRIDKKIEYKLATPQQAHDLFVRWFSVKRGAHIELKADLNLFSGDELEKLAQTFAGCLSPDEFSTAELQGYLLLYKHDPVGASAGFSDWIEGERQARRIKEERERLRKVKADAKKAGGPFGSDHPMGGMLGRPTIRPVEYVP